MILEAQRRMTPFRWRDLEQHRKLGEASAGILELALSYGWMDGLVVPVHGPAGYQGVVSLAIKRILALVLQAGFLWLDSAAERSGASQRRLHGSDRRETVCLRRQW